VNIIDKLFALIFAPKKCVPCFHCRRLIDPDHSDFLTFNKTSYTCHCVVIEKFNDGIHIKTPGFLYSETGKRTSFFQVSWENMVVCITKSGGSYAMYVYNSYYRDGIKGWDVITIPYKNIDHFTSEELYSWARRIINFI
jgi:hypothetical protein